MTAEHVPLPSWSDFAIRVLIYTALAGVAFWWHMMLGVFVALFVCIDLLHHAADMARRRAGYRPIARHPSVPGTPKAPLERTGRALLLIFALVWFATAATGKALLGTVWAEALVQSLAVAGFVTIISVLLFPPAAIVLLWVMSVTLGVLLSLADLFAAVLAPAGSGKAWHRAIDAVDHRLADAILGQQAVIPLRADLAERAAMQAKDVK